MKLHPASRTTFALLLAGALIVGCSNEESSAATDLGDVAAPETLVTDTGVLDTGKAALSSTTSALRVDIPCTPPAPQLVINEFLADPDKVSDAYGEWVELFNPGATAIDLNGWTLKDDGSNIHKFATSILVPPGGYVVLCRNANTGVNGGVNCTYAYSNFLLTNTPAVAGGPTDQIVLLDPNGAEVDRVDLFGTVPTGYAVELRHPYLAHGTLTFPTGQAVNNPAAWDGLNFGITATTFGLGDKGTPGARNGDDVYREQDVAECAGLDSNPCTYNTCAYDPVALITKCIPAKKAECCTSLADCDDKNVCTADNCDIQSLKCSHTAVPNCCTANDQCIDQNPCNADYCQANQCRHSAYNILPGCCYVDPTTDPATGLPWASPTVRQAAADKQCDDKNACTKDACNLQTNLCEAGSPVTGCCTTDAQCDDKDICTYDQCIGNTCLHPKVNSWCCTSDAQCDDGNACTQDLCILNSCRHPWGECCTNDGWCRDHADDGNPCTVEKCAFNATTKLYECQHPFLTTCQVPLPYVETFDGAASFTAIGWKIVDYGTKALAHWLLDIQSMLGPDKHVDFVWNPTTVFVKSVAVTPQINASTSATNIYNTQQKTTLQFRMAYKHSQPGKAVLLKVVASDNGDFTGTPLRSWQTDVDIEYTLVSISLPDAIKFSPTLRIGFFVDTLDSSTFNMDAWTIDDVKVAAGVPNELLKSMIYRCPAAPASCDLVAGKAEKIAEAAAPAAVPDLTLSTCQHFRAVLCYADVDATSSSWNFNGFPGSYLDSPPMDQPTFVTAATDQQANGCNTLPIAVAPICGAGAKFFCVLEVQPNCDEALAGNYHSAIVTRDEMGPKSQSAFETQVKFNVNVILPDGYIVWSPNGTSDPSATALFNQIKANGRKVQILRDLSMIPDLKPYKGVFAVLGVYGRYHVMTGAEAARLQVYLDNGGKVYVEGGDYFFVNPTGGQPLTNLHPYFKIDATSDGVSKLDGPVNGSNFLWRFGFDYDQNGIMNSWIDRLTHTPGAGGREILRNAGAKTFATAVSYDSGTYRTIGSSVAFGGLLERSDGGTLKDLMGKYLYFFENGYPPCVDVAQCEDYEVCTDDACNASACENTPRPACVPCKDDLTRPDGSTPACGDDEACDIAKGYCVPIPFLQRFDATADCNKLFGASPTQADCTIDVPTAAQVTDLHVKVMVSHPYRGDVRLSLMSPTGTKIALKDNSATDAGHNVYATYDIGVPTPVLNGLNAVNGEHLNGKWKVLAEDLDPMVYNGLFQDWRVYATSTELGCNSPADCPDDPCSIAKDCVDLKCQYTPLDCDDGNECTVDSCVAGGCVNKVIPGCGGQCATHVDCYDPLSDTHEACLDTATLSRTCDPVADFDPATGKPACECATIEGQVFKMTGSLPMVITDNLPTGVDAVLPVVTKGYVKSMKVLVWTDHAAQGDLRLKLCHGGTCETLRSQRGGNMPGFLDIYDYDPLEWPSTLADYDKKALDGDWTLNVADMISGDTGRLTAFRLYVVKADCYQDADCDDDNPCTVDVCQLPHDGGTCVHTTKQCEPTTDPCKINECNPANGLCELKAQTNGTPCEDGQYCTTDDSCLAGVCTGGPARDCSYLDGSCVTGVCNEDLKQCRPAVSPDDTPCDDGDFCITGDYCLAGACQPGCVGGVCHPGAANTCPCPNGDNDCVDDGNKCNGVTWKCNLSTRLCELQDGPVVCPPATGECKTNVCDPSTGGCRAGDALNYMPCEDGGYCTVADYCLGGACQGGQARDCSALDDECVQGVCNDVARSCQASSKADGTACELDGRGCTNDACLGGVCAFQAMVDCSVIKDDCNDGVCQDVGWGGHVCVKGPLPDGTICTDEPDACTSDRCNQGLCVHSVLQNCNGPCGGSHPFDAGDKRCGFEDSCQGGIQGPGLGACVPTCSAANCRKVASTLLDLPIDEKIGCTVAALDLNTEFAYVDELEAKVRLDHGFLGDLTIDIVDPKGYSHRVWNHIGGSNANFSNTFDLSFPIPYPGIPTSGVPMCALQGDDVNGTWYLNICDTGAGNGGVLHDWKIYVKGSDDPNLNMGLRCDKAIDLGPQDINPAAVTDGSTACALNSITDSGCGGVYGPDRTYKFQLEAPKRVTIRLYQPDRDLILVVKEANLDGTCAAGAKQCSQVAGVGATPEIVDDQFLPGNYFLSVDTNGGPYDRGTFRFEIRVKTLLENGANCVDPILGPQDLDCLSMHCQNGYCCDSGDCCPSEAWPVPADGTDPNLIRADPQWLDADTICPAQYKAPTVCRANDDTFNPPINSCQGDRWDANCVNHQCVKTRVDDDTACDNSVESDKCGHYVSTYCGDFGPVPPAAQSKPPCLGYCLTDTDCDLDSHCDPASPTAVDNPASHTMTCVPDWQNGAECNENSDCQSGHCQNGYCCDSGDCCPTSDVPGALKCPAAWTVAPICDDFGTCEGHRYDPVCANNECGQVLVHDDCACGGSLSDNCGLFIPVFCSAPGSGTCPATAVGAGEWHGGDPACLTSCLVGGVEDDSKCDDIAHCDPDPDNPTNSICKADIPNGFPCNEGSDCKNKQYLPGGIGHCQNGFCCDSGDCCAANTDCPIQDPPSGYWEPSVCDDATTCQGHRMDATCVNSICGTDAVPDDTACTAAMVSDNCGYYLPVYCNGAADQVDPPCPLTCLTAGVEDDTKCDADAHCDPDTNLPNQTNSICVADLLNDLGCNEPSDCVSGFCQLHFCCDAGLCCKGCKVTQAILSTGMGGTNDNAAGCDMANNPGGCPAGTLQVQTSLGQESVVERAFAPGQAITDLGFLAGAAVNVQCYDLVRDVLETDVDCGGGVCPKCANGKECRDGARDCVSGKCDKGWCIP